MDYAQSITYFENIKPSKGAYGLTIIKKLLERLGNPHHKLKVIHLAGTNGKGSISNFLKTILMVQGYNIGLYNSPYISTPRETISFNALQIPESTFAEISDKIIITCTQLVNDGYEHPSAFECFTALAFQYFADINVDFAIIEVGLGGLNDATNVFDSPLLSIITSIDYDHTQFLGNTLESIAYAKAGIIKKDTPVVVAPNEVPVLKVINKKAQELDAPVFYTNWEDTIVTMYENNLSGMTFSITTPYFNYTQLSTTLIGEHQLVNILVLLTSLHVLSEKHGIIISDNSIKEGIAKTYWPCRCEYLNKPLHVLIDGAHNISSMNSLIQVLDTYCKETPITFLFGALSDKDVENMLSQMATYSNTIFITEPISPRSMSISELNCLSNNYFEQVIPNESLNQALEEALVYAKKHSTLLCCVGSLYLAIPVKKRLEETYPQLFKTN